MDLETTQTERTLDETSDDVIVLEPGSPYPEDDLITPGEFDIA